MKHFTLKISLIFFILSSCNNENDKIEIYLTEKQIETKEGIPIEIAFKGNKSAEYTLERYKNKSVRYDTIKKDFVYFGKFKAEKKDLQKKPIIEDAEIIGYDLKNSLIYLSESGMKKISKLHLNEKDNYGRQFVVCINNKPYIFGYFVNELTSFWPNTYEIGFIPNVDRSTKNPKEKYDYIFTFGKKFRSLDSLNETELIKALKLSNRIIK